MSAYVNVRAPAVAGSFYPGDGEELHFQLQQMLSRASLDAVAAATPIKAIIVPHAGYIYSGPVAASVYARLQAQKEQIRRVILIGPAHRVYTPGIALPAAGAFATPLGVVPLDGELMAKAAALPFVETHDDAHQLEHSLETQLPFLQEVLEDFSLLPLVVGGAEDEQIARLLEELWGGPETLIVVSSDLSHYHDYDTALKMDSQTSAAIETLNAGRLVGETACGCRGVNALLWQARRHDLRATTVDLRNSGDTAGDRRRVVGYGGWIFTDNAATEISPENREMLLKSAARSIRNGLVNQRRPQVKLGSFAREIENWRAAFVTLKLDGRLRGCIGSLRAHQPLISDVVQNAYSAAFEDPRFAPLGKQEFARLEISISVLGVPGEMEFADEADLIGKLRPGTDGLILEQSGHRGLFLPQVWEELPEPPVFLSHLKTKAGLPQAPLTPQTRVSRFSVESFGDLISRMDI